MRPRRGSLDNVSGRSNEVRKQDVRGNGSADLNRGFAPSRPVRDGAEEQVAPQRHHHFLASRSPQGLAQLRG